MTPSRRHVFAGLGAAALAPSLAMAEDQDAAVRMALNEAATLPPAGGLRRLAGVAATGTEARLDLGAARAGLSVDLALTRFPSRDEQLRRLVEGRAAGRPGALRLTDGNDWYALQLRRQLGDGIGVLDGERRLTSALARLHRRADRLFASLGLRQGTIGARFSRLFADPAYLYADDDAGRDRAVSDMNVMLDSERARVTRLVGPVPAASLTVSVRRLSIAEQNAGRGGYRDLPTPGRAGSYVVDLKDVRRRPSWTLPSVVAHELLPGHMVQLPIEAQTPPHALRAEYTPAFSEGWGIYAETLAARDFRDARVVLGHLHWLIFRAARGLVDFGIHLHGWKLDQAHAALVGWQGEPAYFAPFTADLQRIAVEPGIRAAEALMWLALDHRTAGLGDNARRRSHQSVLIGGRKRLEQLP